MRYMAQEPACRVGTTAMGDLLEIVQEGLLVVKFPEGMGTFNDESFQQRPGLSIPAQANGSGGDESSGTPEPTEPTPTATSQGVPQIDIPSISVVDIDQDVSLATAEPPDVPTPALRKPDSKGPRRFRATDLVDRLEYVVTDEDPRYWFAGHGRKPPPVDFDPLSSDPISVETENDQTGSGSLRLPERPRVDYGDPKLDPDDWEFKIDNDFASSVFSAIKNRDGCVVPEARISTKLCVDCKRFRDQLWNPGFNITYSVQELETRANRKECDLCWLLWRTCEPNWGTLFPTIQFERIDSSLRMNGGHLPVLSIFRSSGKSNPNMVTILCLSYRTNLGDLDHTSQAVSDVQIGFAELPEAHSNTRVEVIRRWLDDCDEKHRESTCKPAKRGDQSNNTASGRLPTRLIDVGNVGDQTVRLWETSPEDTGEWIALSHQWGPLPHFSTNRQNREDHIAGMRYDEFPSTFKDAVTVTRALGRRYLWIDSICILQGPDGDFKEESKRMEDVYSGAYCVIAASCASSHYSGFLETRNKRDYVALRREAESEAPFYICQNIDNFKGHVLEGALNRRGWVLQEHALAQRTIFFTEHQTYWECGHGVRCETMTKLYNESAQLLGDPNFPQILDSAPQGDKIIRYQQLYQIYSRLGLSMAYDRPTAIGGLQQRLLRTLNVQGGFGVFDEGKNRGLLRRSLLWHRGEKVPSLTRIVFPADRAAVPSWSWMAYTGGIDYLNLDFGGMQWEDLESPWSRREDGEGDNALIADAREYDRHKAAQGEDLLIFDTPAGSDRYKPMCVVLGIRRGSMPRDDRRHCILLVVPMPNPKGDGTEVFERVGVGYLPGKCITSEASVVHIH